MCVCRIVEESPAALAEYCRVPITFEVRSQLEVVVRDGSSGESHWRKDRRSRT